MKYLILLITFLFLAGCASNNPFLKTEIWVEPPKITIDENGEMKVGPIHGHVRVTPKDDFLKERK